MGGKTQRLVIHDLETCQSGTVPCDETGPLAAENAPSISELQRESDAAQALLIQFAQLLKKLAR
jgi:hypothetical protein